ncbi:MAG: type II secretion system F family protein [Phycisphaerales bacterium]|jgi:type IV pilus assembly protein PilC
MAVYDYTARDETGNTLTGTYQDVENVTVLREELAKLDCSLVKARRRKEGLRRWDRIKPSEVVTFVFQFAEMYSAGLSIVRCIQVLQEQSRNRAFASILANVRQNIENGSSLEQAFGQYRDVFSVFLCGMLEAGESGSKLSEALQMSAEYLQKKMEMRRKIIAAFAYPVVVAAVCLVVVTCLVIFVVPVFSKLYDQMHVALPGPTQGLVILSSLVRDSWPAVLLALAGTIAMGWSLIRKPRVRTWWDAFKLEMPLLGRINHTVLIAHFTRTLGMLLSVDVSPLRALDVASTATQNQKLAGIATALKGDIQRGQRIGDSLMNHDIFPPMITRLAVSGEEAGDVANMLTKGAEFMDRDAARMMNALVVKLEPALTLLIGLLVGLILMAIYLPIFDYMRYLE